MKILIVCGSFYPIQSPRSFRSTELAKELSRQGHQVTVITPRNELAHNGIEKKYGIEVKDLGPRPMPKKIPPKGWYHWIVRAQKRVLQLLFEYPSIKFMRQTKKALKREANYDLLISVAVPFPIHWGVASIWDTTARGNNPAKVWVADCGDPYINNRNDSFPKMPWFHYFENKFLRKADYISVPFEEMIELFNLKYKSKFKVIPQGFKFNDENTNIFIPNPEPTLIFAGGIIPGFRAPFSLIDYLLNKDFDFKFILYTKQQHLFSKYKPHLEKKIIIRDYIPRKKLLNELSKADFLVNVNTDSKAGKINAIPTKLIDYRISGRPILSYEHSTLPESIVDEFMSGSYQNQFIDKNFDRYRIENVAQKFLALANA